MSTKCATPTPDTIRPFVDPSVAPDPKTHATPLSQPVRDPDPLRARMEGNLETANLVYALHLRLHRDPRWSAAWQRQLHAERQAAYHTGQNPRAQPGSPKLPLMGIPIAGFVPLQGDKPPHTVAPTNELCLDAATAIGSEAHRLINALRHCSHVDPQTQRINRYLEIIDNALGTITDIMMAAPTRAQGDPE